MTTIEAAFDLLATCHAVGPASEESVREAEVTLAVRFPPSYRRFLKTYGAVVCDGFTIAGLSPPIPDDQTPFWDDLVRATLRCRSWRGGNIPHNYLLIGEDGGDYRYYLLASNEEGTSESPVVVLGPGADNVVIAESFPEFVLRVYNDKLVF